MGKSFNRLKGVSAAAFASRACHALLQRSRKPAKILSAAVAATMGLMPMENANASFTINYQFDSAGTTTRNITLADIGTTVSVQVWGQVSIAPSDSGIVGIAFNEFRAQSQQVGTGGAFSAGGAGTFSAAADRFNNVSVRGLVSDNNADGVLDLGLASGNASTSDAKARTVANPIDGVFPAYYSDEGGWIVSATSGKVQLGSFKVAIQGSLGTGTTKFNVLLPQNAVAASWFENVSLEDGTHNTFPTIGSYLSGTSVSFVGPPPSIRYALTTHNDATLGTANSKSLAVVGNNGNYMDPGPVGNYAPANGTTADYAIANANLGVGDQMPVLVMVDFNLGVSGLTMAQLESGLLNAGDIAATSIVGPTDIDADSQRALLLSQYQSFGADAAHVLLFEFLTAPGAVSNGLHFGFDLTGSGVSVLHAIAVPEPASALLLTAGALGLLKVRRKRH